MGPWEIFIENNEVVSWVSVWTPLPEFTSKSWLPCTGTDPRNGLEKKIPWSTHCQEHLLCELGNVPSGSLRAAVPQWQLNAEQPNGARKPAYRHTHTSWWRQQLRRERSSVHRQSILHELLREVLDLPRLYVPKYKIVQKRHQRPWHLRYKREKRWNSLLAVNMYKNNFMIPKCSGELHYEKRVFIAIFFWKCVSDA